MEVPLKILYFAFGTVFPVEMRATISRSFRILHVLVSPKRKVQTGLWD
jgi:hypothetical protein